MGSGHQPRDGPHLRGQPSLERASSKTLLVPTRLCPVCPQRPGRGAGSSSQTVAQRLKAARCQATPGIATHLGSHVCRVEEGAAVPRRSQHLSKRVLSPCSPALSARDAQRRFYPRPLHPTGSPASGPDSLGRTEAGAVSAPGTAGGQGVDGRDHQSGHKKEQSPGPHSLSLRGALGTRCCDVPGDKPRSQIR